MANLLPGLPFRDYIKQEGISTTQIKAMTPTPLNYWDTYLSPDREKAGTTDDMILSNAARLLVHEADSWPEQYAIIPEGIDRRSTEGKKLFADVEARGVQPIKKAEADKAQSIAEAICGLGTTQSIFSQPGGQHGAVITWEHRATQQQCKVRLDFHVPPCEQIPNGLIWATKTASKLSDQELERQAFNASYHLSAAMQIDGFMAYYGTEEPPIYIWAFATPKRPFMARAKHATPQQINMGADDFQALIEQLAECTANNEWPGYPDELTALGIPGYAKPKEII